MQCVRVSAEAEQHHALAVVCSRDFMLYSGSACQGYGLVAHIQCNVHVQILRIKTYLGKDVAEYVNLFLNQVKFFQIVNQRADVVISVFYACTVIGNEQTEIGNYD